MKVSGCSPKQEMGMHLPSHGKTGVWPCWCFFFSSVRSLIFMSVKPAARWAMPLGNSTAWNMGSIRMVPCLPTIPSALETTLSIRSFPRPAPESMFQEPFLWTSNPPLLTRSRRAPTSNSSTRLIWLWAKKMRLIITPEDTTPLARSKSEWPSTRSAPLPSSVWVYR